MKYNRPPALRLDRRPCACPLCGAEAADLPMAVLPERGLVVVDGATARLTKSEMVIFARLAEVHPRVLSRGALMDWLYQLDPGGGADDPIINQFVLRLRRKLGPLGVGVVTVYKRGFYLTVPGPRPRVVREKVAA